MNAQPALTGHLLIVDGPGLRKTRPTLGVVLFTELCAASECPPPQLRTVGPDGRFVFPVLARGTWLVAGVSGNTTDLSNLPCHTAAQQVVAKPSGPTDVDVYCHGH